MLGMAAFDRSVLCYGEIKHSERFAFPRGRGMMARMRYTSLALLKLLLLLRFMCQVYAGKKRNFGPSFPLDKVEKELGHV